MSFIAVTHSYRPQLRTHTPLSYFHCTGSEVKAPRESRVCSECCQHKRPARGVLPCPAGPAAVPGASALCSHHSSAAAGLTSCWCTPAVQARCEELGWPVKCWTTGCDFIPPLLLSAAFAAVVNLVPVTLSCVDLHKTGLGLLPTACAKNFRLYH